VSGGVMECGGRAGAERVRSEMRDRADTMASCLVRAIFSGVTEHSRPRTVYHGSGCVRGRARRGARSSNPWLAPGSYGG
jgi:hypothetical protein